MDRKIGIVIDRYTTPFVQLVIEKQKEDAVYETLTTLINLMEETKLVTFLSHIGVDADEKERVVRLLQKSDQELINNLIDVVILNKREDLLYTIFVHSIKELEKATNTFDVTLTSVSPLSAQQKERLLPLIEKKLGIKVRTMKEEVDSSLIGGFVITANYKTIDASIKRQLQLLKENLK